MCIHIFLYNQNSYFHICTCFESILFAQVDFAQLGYAQVSFAQMSVLNPVSLKWGKPNIMKYIILINSVCIYHIETLPICLLRLSSVLNSNIVGKFNLN